MEAPWPPNTKLFMAAVWLASSFATISSFAVGTTSIPLELASASAKIHEMMQEKDASLVEIQGYVIAKRDFGKKLCFFDLADHDTQKTPVQAMWKLEEHDGDDAIHQRLLILPGAQICITGVATPSKNTGQSVLLVRSIHLKGIPQNPQHVRILLQGLLKKQLNATEFCGAANITSIISLQSKLDQAACLQTLAKEIVANQTKSADANILFERQRKGFTLPEPDRELLDVPTITQGGLSANLTVAELLKHENTVLQNVTLRAYIQNRRKFRGNISTIELTDAMINDDQRVKGILHPNLLASLDNLYHIAAPGSQVEVYGIFVKKTHKLWIHSMRILRCSPRPSVVKHMIELLHKSHLTAHAAAVALDISTAEAEAIGLLSITERQWKAEEIANSLQAKDDQGDANDNVLQSYEWLREQYPVSQEADETPNNAASSDNRSTPGSRWLRKKEPQLDWISRRIGDLLKDHPDYGKRKIRILDIGGGQGYLANRLSSLHSNDFIEIQVLDIAEKAVKNGAMRSKRLNHHAVQYSVGDASDREISLKADIVVGLHACGTLTDVALAHAIRNTASFVICPCCYKSNIHLPIPGIVSRQVLSQEAFWGVDERNIDQLRSLAELQLQPNTAAKAAHTICSIRAAAAERFIPEYSIDIKAFPVAYSTRNHCMIGSVRRRS